MKKKFIVKEQRDFNRIINTAKYIKNRDFVIYFEKNNLTYDKYGISVGTKIGKANIRNKYKRRIRVIVDDYKKNYQNGLNYIIMVRKNCLELSYIEMKTSFNKLMEKHLKELSNEK